MRGRILTITALALVALGVTALAGRANRLSITSSADFPLTWIYFVDDGDRVLESIRLENDSTVELPETRPNIAYRIAAPGHAAVPFDDAATAIVLEPHTLVTLTHAPPSARITTRRADGETAPIELPTRACVRRGPDRIELALSPYLGGLTRIDLDIDLDDGWGASLSCPLRAGARHEFSLLHPASDISSPLTILVVDGNDPVRSAEVTVTLADTFASTVSTSANDVSFALSPAAGPPRIARTNDAGIATFTRVPLGSTVNAVARTDTGDCGNLATTVHDGAGKSLRLQTPPRLAGRFFAPQVQLRNRSAILHVVWTYWVDGQETTTTIAHESIVIDGGWFATRLQPPSAWLQSGTTFTVERIEVFSFEPGAIARTFDAAGGDLGMLVLTPMQPFFVLEQFDAEAYSYISQFKGREKCAIAYGDTFESSATILELRALGSGFVAAFGNRSGTQEVAPPYGGEHAVMHIHRPGTTLYLRRTERGTYALVPTQSVTLTLDARAATTSTDDLWISVRWPRADVRCNLIEILPEPGTEHTLEWTVSVPDGGRIVVERFARGANPAKTPPLASWTADLTTSHVRLVVP